MYFPEITIYPPPVSYFSVYFSVHDKFAAFELYLKTDSDRYLQKIWTIRQPYFYNTQS